jgi:hypothetical protein
MVDHSVISYRGLVDIIYLELPEFVFFAIVLHVKDSGGPLHNFILSLPLFIVDSAAKHNVIGAPISVCNCGRYPEPLGLFAIPVKFFIGQIKLCQAHVTLVSVTVSCSLVVFVTIWKESYIAG